MVSRNFPRANGVDSSFVEHEVNVLERENSLED